MSFWDQRYSEDGFAYGEQPNDFVREQANKIAPGPVLCIAEGEGRNAVFLAERGLQVHAMDLSPVGLEKAQALAARHGVTITTEAGDLATYDLGVARWSAIVAIWAHLPPALRRDLNRRVVQALRPGGVFMLEAYTPRQLEMPGVGGPTGEGGAMLMTLAALRDELEGLTFEVGQELVREVHEGRYHEGESAVVQVLARR